MLTNKKVVFIGPVFHDYHVKIKNELIELGADVSFYKERSYGIGFKVINNFFNSKLKSLQDLHYNKILIQEQNKQVDFLFIIRGFMLNESFLKNFKKNHPTAKIIMYQWDSNKTNPFSQVLHYVDKAYSFDFEDCEKIPDLDYLPLFYADDIISAKGIKKEYDFFFMGWFFQERYEALLKFKQFSVEKNYKLKAFLYLPFSSYIKQRLKGNKLDRSVISFLPMSRKKYLDCLNKTKVMVDVSSPNQTGMAMRVIEALASSVKLLTNNKNIMDNSILSKSGNIVFFDENSPSVDPSFVKSGFDNKQNSLLSLNEWLVQLFSGD